MSRVLRRFVNAFGFGVYFCVWLMGGLPSAVFALATDREQPIRIEADTAVIDDVKGLAVYTGNVVITQGTIEIRGDTVTLKYTESQTLEKAVVVGKPARFKQRPDESAEDIHAQAGQMDYFANQDQIVLTQQAEVFKGKDSFKGQRITYDTKQGLIKADQGRVQIVIEPRASGKDKKGKVVEEKAVVEKEVKKP